MPFAPGLGSLPPFEFVTKPPAPNQLGKIIGSVVTSSGVTSINLTTLAGTDWAAFGYNTNAASIQRKASGGSLISALSQAGSIALANFNQSGNTVKFNVTWTDGTPTVSATNENFVVFSGNVANSINSGLSFTVPAGLATQTLIIYAALSLNSASTARAQLTATLSDQSAIPFNNTSFSKSSTSDLDATYTITYAAASDGQTLTIMLLNNTALAQNVQIYAATLAGPLALQASSSIAAAARAAASGAVPILTSTTSGAHGSAGSSVATALRAYAASAAVGRAGATLAAALLAFVGASSAGRAAPTGKIALAAMGAAKGAARAAASVLATGRVALAAVAMASAGGVAFMAGAVALSTMGKTSASAKGVALVATWLSSISGGRGQAAAPVKGVLTLTSTSSARGTGLSAPTVRLPLTSISAFGRGIANAFGALVLKRLLFVDPNYVVQYPLPSRVVQYPDQIMSAQYPAPIRSVSYPGD